MDDCEKMNKQKIAEQLQKLDSLAFGLRMAVTALQSELNPSVTVSTTIVPEKSIYGTVPLDKHDEVEASLVEPRYTGEAALTDIDDPDGFHGKSYKDFEKSRVLPEWKNALCAVKSLRAIARR